MSDKFQNKYRIPSARLQNWDYGSNAAYFVTICTQNRENYFGKIVETPIVKMELSELGKIANQIWNEIPIHFPFVELGEFVVMPNHVHGIIVIDKPVSGDGRDDDGRGGRDAINRVSTTTETATGTTTETATDTTTGTETGFKTGFETETKSEMETDPDTDPDTDTISESEMESEMESETHIGGFAGNKNPMLNNNLSRIVRWYKGRVSFELRKIHAGFAWQSRFYDHIIRDDMSFQRISKYIVNNPSKWADDKLHDGTIL
ncbi:MAG TPA: hypothetical protein PLJ84_01805 [Bacteroidales bacterium]|nr:hypothetical protein [Bacteroidales bacterium]HPT01302.1 hypothetical protein [Bacteroidales bacterium]